MKIGIDFGTSYSQPAIYDRGNVRVLLETGVVYAMPSAFYYDQFTKIKIGEDAIEYGQGDGAEFLVREVKMDMKKSYMLDDKVFSGTDIAGHIIKGIADMACKVGSELNVGSKIEGAIVSVPAAFTHEEKELIGKAAKDIAGINVLGFIKEPVAAAISYFNTPLADNTRVLVYDFGGGTCDVAIVEANQMLRSKYYVVASDMLRIGGKDWDEAIGKYIFSELEKQIGKNIPKDDVELNVEIKNAAIKAKHKITASTKETMVRVPYNGRNYPIVVTEEVIYTRTKDLLNQTLEMVDRLIKENLDNPPTQMICVGGSCYMPMVSDAIKKRYSNLKPQILDPANAIVKGAAIYAANYEKGEFLADIASFSYGIRITDDNGQKFIINLITRGTRLPNEVHDTVITTDGMTEGDIDIYESTTNEKKYKYNDKQIPIISKTMLIPKGTPAGTNIDVTMKLSNSGLLTFVAKDPNGKPLKIETTVDL